MDPTAFARLLSPQGERLMAALPAYDESAALGLVERLRREGYDGDLVAAALTQARLRSRAAQKFGDLAGRLWFTATGLEQATRRAVAEHHARRFAEAGVRRVADLCCGVGGDALALAAAGMEVLAVDRDPLACAVAGANARALRLDQRVEVRCADVTAVDVSACDGVWIDPARRGEHGRVFAPGAYTPAYPVVLDLLGRAAAAGAKLAPGLPHHLLPAGTEAEWVSDGGEVKEVALWRGPLASPGVVRRATLLPAGATLTGSGAERGAVGPVRRWLYEPDGAVIRAGLVAAVCAEVGGTLVDPSIAYVTSDALVATPFATAYEVTDVLAFSVKRLRSLLRSRAVGSVVVKKRGSAVEPAELVRQLRLRGDATATIVLTRVGGDPAMLVVRRV